MRWSELFIPTLRENPAQTESLSRQLLQRAGYARRLDAGALAYLYLGRRSLSKAAQMIREEMNRAGAQEMQFPGEAAVSIARELRSYKQLPQIWYRIQQDGGRLAMDAWPFHRGASGPEIPHGRIFGRCGLPYFAAEAGPDARRFMVEQDSGESIVARCGACGYQAVFEMAKSIPAATEAADPADASPEEIYTPGQKTIASLARFLGASPTNLIKSVVMVADGKPVLLLGRGDHQLSDAKVRNAMGADDVRAARAEEIVEWFGAEPGSLGPVGVRNMRVVADEALRGRRNMVCGANKNDYHLKNVTPGRDFEAVFHDLRQTSAGEACVTCAGPLGALHAMEIGRLGALRLSGLKVTGEAGEECALRAEASNIGIEAILWAASALYHDADGMALPPSIAPFQAVITPVNISDGAQSRSARDLYAALNTQGIDTLLDDRDERPGVKFKDADLTGIPLRAVIGRRIGEGKVEIKERRSRQSWEIDLSAACGRIRELLTGVRDGN